jgi:L,D-transpeptidase catalytic domain
MIERQQIADALGRLQARDREILDYSLRRRVPDDDLAALFGSDSATVARRRADAIEALAADLGAQRGADLGHMLKELLEADTWSAVTTAEPTAPGAPAERPAEHPPLGALDNPAAAHAAEEKRSPVLGMLGDERRRGGGRAGRRLLVVAAAAVAVLVPAGVVYAITSSDTTDPQQADSGSATRSFSPQRQAPAEPFPSDPQSAYQFPTAKVTRRTALYTAPGGRVRLKVGPKTEWGSPRILGVVERRGSWLAVLAPELKNGQRVWVRDDRVAAVSTVSWAMKADLSRRRLVVEHNGKVVRRIRIGVGRPDHPTPVGRYAVTDKLKVSDPGSPYGCCVLALTGHQTRLPAGWPGGDRLAVHATQDLGGLGHRVSLGCMRTDPRDTRWLLGRIPLGAPVFIHA